MCSFSMQSARRQASPSPAGRAGMSAVSTDDGEDALSFQLDSETDDDATYDDAPGFEPGGHHHAS